jgi:hypothetical protein
MTQKYILSLEDLENLMHESIIFFSEKAREKTETHAPVMFSDIIRWTKEFLESHLRLLPVGSFFNKTEEEISSFIGTEREDINIELWQKMILSSMPSALDTKKREKNK